MAQCRLDLLYPEKARWRRHQQLALRDCRVEPLHYLTTMDDRAVPLLKMRDLRIGRYGIWRSHPEVGEAFTMLTMDAGDEIARYAKRQIIPLTTDQWIDWLDPRVPAADVLAYLPVGGLDITQVYPPPEPELEMEDA